MYFFTLELTTGQTVGKRLLGLRVMRADGGRPSAWAIGARTLLRIIDWLPFLYLTGFIAMLFTGKHRQRLGDLAARTAVPRTVPRGGLAAVPLVLVVLAAAGLAAYRVDSAESTLAYRAHGVSIDYPAGWRSLPVSGLHLRQGGDPGRLWAAVLGIGRYDLITVIAYAQAPPVTAANLAAITPYFTRSLRRYLAQGGMGHPGGPRQDHNGRDACPGVPGYRTHR